MGGIGNSVIRVGNTSLSDSRPPKAFQETHRAASSVFAPRGEESARAASWGGVKGSAAERSEGLQSPSVSRCQRTTRKTNTNERYVPGRFASYRTRRRAVATAGSVAAIDVVAQGNLQRCLFSFVEPGTERVWNRRGPFPRLGCRAPGAVMCCRYPQYKKGGGPERPAAGKAPRLCR